PPLERNVVEVELRRLEADRFLQAGQVDRMAIEVKRLLGMRAGDALQVRDSLGQLVDRGMNAPGETDVALALRPDVQEAEARLRVADAQVDRAQRDGRFDMNVFGSYMRMDATFPQFGVNTHGDLVPIHGLFHYLSAGVNVILPLRNQNQGEVAKAQ